MYLLNPDYDDRDSSVIKVFTFHYVSIKSTLKLKTGRPILTDLHSTMYLLNPEQGDKITYELKFTFHYVSIKSVLRFVIARCVKDLHSTMYLLNPALILMVELGEAYLHSTMYLLNHRYINK